MKRKFLSIALSTLIGCAAVCCPYSVSETSIVAEAEETYTDGTYGLLTYKAYSDHIEISDCDTSATEIEISSEIDGLPVTKIADKAFYECRNLTDVIIPDSITSIGYEAFYWCTSLTSITIPDSVTSIGDYAFYCCASLTSIIIPDSVTRIGIYAFAYCYSLTSITIPDNITSIGGKAFTDTSWLEEQQQINPFVIVNNILIDGTTCEGDVVIPDSVTSIGEYAFQREAFHEGEDITSVIIPDSVTSIEWGAFGWCPNLTSITIPDSVTSIGGDAFASCTNLKSVTILNPYCNIWTLFSTISNDYYSYNGIIYGYADSTAQEYAERYDYTFEAIISSIYSLGDLDASGTVDPVDATLALQHYSLASMGGGLLTEEQAQYADVNGDGAIDPVDATYILRYYSYASMNGEGTFEEFIENN